MGVPDGALDAGVAASTVAAIKAAIETFAALGLTVETVTLPSLHAALPAYYVLAPAEASSNLARYDGVRFGRRVTGADLAAMYAETRGHGFGAEVKRRIMLGTYVLSAGYYDAFYLTAQHVRRLVAGDFAEALGRVDVIVMPVAPTTAFAIGERADDPMTMYLSDVFTIPVSLAGLPALTIPCGSDGRLPIALQLIGRAFDESRLLRVGYAYQQVTDWHRRRPPALH
jgi:aspartyl-tRNA(Asn)/glutamyl-tRNA(Gln) amidotransferase subunit A